MRAAGRLNKTPLSASRQNAVRTAGISRCRFKHDPRSPSLVIKRRVFWDVLPLEHSGTQDANRQEMRLFDEAERSLQCHFMTFIIYKTHDSDEHVLKQTRCHRSCPVHQLTLGMCLITFFEDAVFVIPLLQPALLRRHLSWPADSSRVPWRHRTQCRGGFRGVLKYGSEVPPPV